MEGYMQRAKIIYTIYFIFSLMLIGCNEPKESGTLYGVMTDAITGEPVSSAMIELQPSGIQTTTGTDGWYQFPEIEAGEYEMSVSKSGYEIYKQSDITVTNGPVRYDIKLAPFPFFIFEGRVYAVAPDAGSTMTLSEAEAYCHSLSQYGFSDWRLPTRSELAQMYADKESIGGFQDKVYWSSTYSSTTQNVDLYYVIHFLNGNELEANPGSKLRVRPVRVDG